jgi:hypothetical protein
MSREISDEAYELCVFTENDGDIYRSRTQPILKNLATKRAQGKYDSEKAVDLFMYLAEDGAKRYVKEHGGPGDIWYKMFPLEVRREAARKWRDEFEIEVETGAYDNFLPKKYQKK